MAARANYVKLGLFVVAGVVGMFLLAMAVGVVRLRKKTVPYVTYFSESVDGLDVGAPVKARGVPLGRVGEITFAPDHEHVEVRLDFDIADVRAMGMDPAHIRSEARTQLGSQGLLGAKYVAIDLFDEATHPPPEIHFKPPAHYIPSTPSVRKNLEDSITKTLDRLAVLADDFANQGLPEKTADAVTSFDTFMRDLDQTLHRLDNEKLPARAAKAIEDMRGTIAKLNEAVAHLNGDNGTLAAATRAFGSVDEVGRSASAGTADLKEVLDELRAAAAAIRELAEQLQQHPDMLLKGRKKP
jgi:ABC-type transporter Mla subunit MlaD